LPGIEMREWVGELGPPVHLYEQFGQVNPR
jgi:hypothetical protein